MRLFSSAPHRSEHRRRRKEYDHDDEDNQASFSHKPRKPRKYQQKRAGSLTSRSSSSSPASRGQTPRMAVPEMERRVSADASNRYKANSIPYPTFSKAHSREAVRKIDSQTSLPRTPEPTEIDKNRAKDTKTPSDPVLRHISGQPPPSPPLTNIGSNSAKSNITQEAQNKAPEQHKRTKSQNGRLPYNGKAEFSASRSSLRQAEEGVKSTDTTKLKYGETKSSSKTDERRVGVSQSPGRGSSANGSPKKRVARNLGQRQELKTGDSDVTSVAPDNNASRSRKVPSVSPQSERPDTPLRDTKPVQLQSNSSNANLINKDSGIFSLPNRTASRSPGIEVFTAYEESTEPAPSQLPLATDAQPPPPPPPPPPEMSETNTPKVDYLLQNGGLDDTIPRSFAAAADPPPVQLYQQYTSPQPQQSRYISTQPAFSAYHKLLDDYLNVLSKDGSIAVATGYRSVARRLLDRLETVFARNISSETCTCTICTSTTPTSPMSDDDRGVSWGEVLELVSGRRQLPSWPPFSLVTSGTGLGISSLDNQPPMQKLDVDVPDEYRDHYVRQSKKTKQAVQNWLATQPEDQVSPPQEVDDETLTFAMLTYLEPDRRRQFTTLVRTSSNATDSRSPTPLQTESKYGFMKNVGLALKRLYRLKKLPRDPECAMFLVKNPSLHNALATLAAISEGEWEILISGRFDGFLWSGSEDQQGIVSPISPDSLSNGKNPLSRTTTPGGPTSNNPSQATNRKGPLSRRGTPAPTATGSSNVPGPVQIDEETEIAVLAEVEREIYLGMEALEDAFEALHVKAETVRRNLRDRSAGLALAAKSRRGSAEEDVEVRLGTPAVREDGIRDAVGQLRSATDEDDGIGDERSELAPDDSASNAGFKERERRGRRKRRLGGKKDKKTDMVLEEEEGSEVGKRR